MAKYDKQKGIPTSLNQGTDSNCPMSPEAVAATFLFYLAKNRAELEMGKHEIEVELKIG